MRPLLVSSNSALRFLLCVAALASLPLRADVGTGAPAPSVTQSFINAYFRNGFAYLVSLPPINDVTRFGATGLVQEFRDVDRTANVRLALVRASTSPTITVGLDVAQVLADMYGYYSSVGPTTAGYPTADTQLCPAFDGNSCQYQFFSNSYVLFAYQNPTFNGQNFAVRAGFYTKWSALGGINGLGRATDVERAVTIQTINSTVQLYANGAIYSITSGINNGRVFAVPQPYYALYQQNNGHDGFLGLPTSDEIILPDGRHRITFQGGNLESDGGSASIKLPVAAVSLTPTSSGTIRLKSGETMELRALVVAANGATLNDRVVTWTTSNGSVVTIQSNGATATLRAVGAGSANIAASSEGKVSPVITAIVTAQCCQVGEGAPSAVVAQAFVDAVTRLRLSIALPAQNPVRRVGTGYVQELFTTGTPGFRYLFAKSDRIAAAYALTGLILTRYEQLGGPAGSLGYPTSDASAAGRQLFETSSALFASTGSPARLVQGSILTKWATLGYEGGVLGAPTSEAEPISSSTAATGQRQVFSKATVIAISSGRDAGDAFFLSGLILARYTALSGPSGPFGFPTSDEFGEDGRRRQNFEGGYFNYAPGDANAVEHTAPRSPAVSAFPQTVVAGNRVRLAVSGFTDGARLRVSITGQPDFLVTAAGGAYVWETYIPLTATGGVVTIRAVDTNGTATAQSTYNIRALAEIRAQLAKTQGDTQNGAPGALLPQKLRVTLRDDSGNPIIGAAVVFNASPGAQVVSASTATDEAGQAEASVRMPLNEGVALFSVEAARAVTTFSARVAPVTLDSFPRQAQAAERGALGAAASSILRFHQNRGDLPSTSGFADPARVAQFLRDFCVASSDGQLCDGVLTNTATGGDVLNLWRLAGFVNNQIDLSAEPVDLPSIRDLLAQGSPVLLSLTLISGAATVGGNVVVAIGIAADGSILIHDPDPAYARSNLADYLNGFSAANRQVRGAIAGALRFNLKTPPASAFLLASVAEPFDTAKGFSVDVLSAAGSCGRNFDVTDSASALTSRFRYCEGSQSIYQLDLATALAYRATLTDLAQGGRATELAGGGSNSYKVARVAGQLSLGPLDVTFTPDSIVNAATFEPGIAPGSLAAIFGAGLSGAAGPTTVEFDGTPAQVVSRSPFQLNIEVPNALAPGLHNVRIQAAHGAAEQTVEVRQNAPAIFILGAARQGAVVNQDGRLNSPVLAARRGQVVIIYVTGLGAVDRSGALSVTRLPVNVVLSGRSLPVAFAGLAPGFVGLYQVNVLIPADTPPGLTLSLLLRQNGVDSNTVALALQ